MAKLDIKTRDYIIQSLNQKFDDDVIQAIIMRLSIHRGKYWANNKLGSRLYLLKRSKDVQRNKLLAKQYAMEALEDLVPNRLEKIDISALNQEQSQIDLNIEITQLNGEKKKITYFVPVGG